MKNIQKFWLPILVSVLFAGCVKDLDQSPKYGDTNTNFYVNEANYKSALAKVYAGLALTGNSGPDGAGDLAGIDEGFSSYLRNYWNLQELPTDEAVIAWNDRTIKDFHEMDWNSSDIFLQAFYARIMFQITLANAFIKESKADVVSSRGISGANATNIQAYNDEARLLRAISYYHAMDLYGSPTFVTENDPIGAFIPQAIKRAELFTWLEKELKELENVLATPRSNEYGRVDRASAWMLLANMYLNAEVYTGTARWADAVTYAKKVIDAGYTLDPVYRNMFLADNHTSPEFIFAVPFDGVKMRTWGGTTFLAHASVGASMSPSLSGIDGGWGGIRATSAFVSKFSDPSGATDKRAQFYTEGQRLQIDDIGLFTDGYAVPKYRNVTKTGAMGSNLTWVDIDFPLFRLGEAYLIYAEAQLRSGNQAEALTYFNKLRDRAYGNSNGRVAVVTLQDILDERARELHWEGKRRTDLIRYNQFTTADYLWPWKGNTASGRAVSSFRNLYPLPASDVNANKNLVQNTGY